MNINYLVLRNLHNLYMVQPGPFKNQAGKIYRDLRKNLIGNMFTEYKRTNYVWEHYSCVNGEGSGSHPFTGFSALVLMAMAEEY